MLLPCSSSRVPCDLLHRSEYVISTVPVHLSQPNHCEAAAVQELVRKKRYGRLQKALADISLLAGSPADAQDHYTTAAELCRVSNDWLWTAAALQGLANAKVIFFLLPVFSVCVYICLSVCLSVCRSVGLSVCLCMCLCLGLGLCLCVRHSSISSSCPDLCLA